MIPKFYPSGLHNGRNTKLAEGLANAVSTSGATALLVWTATGNGQRAPPQGTFATNAPCNYLQVHGSYPPSPELMPMHVPPCTRNPLHMQAGQVRQRHTTVPPTATPTSPSLTNVPTAHARSYARPDSARLHLSTPGSHTQCLVLCVPCTDVDHARCGLQIDSSWTRSCIYNPNKSSSLITTQRWHACCRTQGGCVVRSAYLHHAAAVRRAHACSGPNPSHACNSL